jgi:N-acetylmuramoyl-L-alanine amidase
MKIAICAGHYQNAKGATNKVRGLNEHDEAVKVIELLKPMLISAGHAVEVFSGELTKKIAHVNSGQFDLAIDLHFNAGGGHGCEVVHMPKSAKRALQAAAMSKAIASQLNIKDRGAKDGYYQGGTNPGTVPDAFVSKTNCPSFIPEPLFIDNDQEAGYFLSSGRHSVIACALFSAVLAFEELK